MCPRQKNVTQHDQMATSEWAAAGVQMMYSRCGSLWQSYSVCKKSVESVILKLAPCPGVKSATKLLDALAHYCGHQHLWSLQKGWKAWDGEKVHLINQHLFITV